ncbi:ribonuclease H2 complex subunit [Schizosaccharomyces japonicus yFS275]|uniref:Ribonuclease H2 subunit B n=1 Tax=Schizosaccharomyces japonicus (strain yFS275 / FY16936) TaxID=402676 RepID=B6JVI9_SCHJY|nr:ribonuclease H2 complex subunit [Schizosaccharomyces japonicus yFS275]EEB05390.1 ribonuclease H2 complex subunit [Schizosaccharomyces japonicus yFS275]
MPGRVIVAPKGESIQFVQLLHPAEERLQWYGLRTESLLEVIQVGEECPSRSWFIGNEIVADGKVWVCSPCSLLPFVLPVLQELTWNRQNEPVRYVVLEDIKDSFAARGPAYALVLQILPNAFLRALNVACSKKESSNGMPETYQLSKKQVLTYLQQKIQVAVDNLPPSICSHLLQQLTPVEYGKNVPDDIVALAKRRCAIGFVCDGIIMPFASELTLNAEEHKQLDTYEKDIRDAKQRSQHDQFKDPSKRVLTSNNSTTKTKRSRTSESAGARKLKSVSTTNMMKISSFFKKKD